MALKGKTHEETARISRADAQIRRINRMLRKAADTFGIESRMYKEREARALAALRVAGGNYTGGSADGAVLQILRNAQTVKSFARPRSQQSRLLQYMEQDDRVQSIETIKKKMLDQYKKRTGIDPTVVDPSIKGRKERNAARRRQIDEAIKDQADYYTNLNESITEALQEIYAIEETLGQWTQVHSRAKKLNPINAKLKDREKLLKELREEIRRKDHRISTEFESGLSGSILGVGGLPS